MYCVDGKTPYIGDNGNWWIGSEDTGVYAGSKVEPEPEPEPQPDDPEGKYCRVTIKYWSYEYVSRQRFVKKGESFRSILDEMFTPNSPSGFYFVGWYVGDTPFDIDTAINEDTTVEARYAAAAYTDGNGLVFLNEDCKKLVFYNGTAEEITVPDQTVEIAAHAFDGNEYIKTVKIGSNVEVINDYAFANCSHLQTVTFANGTALKEIGEFAFASSGLTSLNIPDSVTTLGIGAFRGTKLTSVVISTDITSLPDLIFDHCRSLETIKIGNNIKNIGDQAFYGCNNLKTVVCESATPPTLGGYILSGVPGLKIQVPAGSADAYKAADIWSTYAPYIVAESN